MSYKPVRTFVGVPGEASSDKGGPIYIQNDIDEINKMFDPTSTHAVDESHPLPLQGGISLENLNFIPVFYNSIAEEYDSTKTYVVGEYVMYEGKAYRCKTAIPVAEEWTASHWENIAVAKELYTHKNDKANPHEVTKAQVGLGNCDNTSDINKPISTATNAEFTNVWNYVRDGANSLKNTKVDKSSVVQVLGSDHTTIPTSKAVSDAMTEAGALPSGGTKNQALIKKSNTNYDTEWKTLLPNGGSEGEVLVKNSSADLDVSWKTVESGDGTDVGDLADMTICAGSANISADWTNVTFPREFMSAPIVTATIVNATLPCMVTIKDVTTTGFKAKINQTVISDGGITLNQDEYYVSTSTSWENTKINIVKGVTYTKQELNIQAITGTINYFACLDLGVGK